MIILVFFLLVDLLVLLLKRFLLENILIFLKIIFFVIGCLILVVWFLSGVFCGLCLVCGNDDDDLVNSGMRLFRFVWIKFKLSFWVKCVSCSLLKML